MNPSGGVGSRRKLKGSTIIIGSSKVNQLKVKPSLQAGKNEGHTDQDNVDPFSAACCIQRFFRRHKGFISHCVIPNESSSSDISTDVSSDIAEPVGKDDIPDIPMVQNSPNVPMSQIQNIKKLMSAKISVGAKKAQSASPPTVVPPILHRTSPRAQLQLIVTNCTNLIAPKKVHSNSVNSDNTVSCSISTPEGFGGRKPCIKVYLKFPALKLNNGSELRPKVNQLTRDFQEVTLNPVFGPSRGCFHVLLPSPQEYMEQLYAEAWTARSSEDATALGADGGELTLPMPLYTYICDTLMKDWWGKGCIKIEILDGERFNEDIFLGEISLMLSALHTHNSATGQYEISGTFPLTKRMASDRVSGHISLQCCIHMPEIEHLSQKLSSLLSMEKVIGDSTIDYGESMKHSTWSTTASITSCASSTPIRTNWTPGTTPTTGSSQSNSELINRQLRSLHRHSPSPHRTPLIKPYSTTSVDSIGALATPLATPSAHSTESSVYSSTSSVSSVSAHRRQRGCSLGQHEPTPLSTSAALDQQLRCDGMSGNGQRLMYDTAVTDINDQTIKVRSGTPTGTSTKTDVLSSYKHSPPVISSVLSHMSGGSSVNGTPPMRKTTSTRRSVSVDRISASRDALYNSPHHAHSREQSPQESSDASSKARLGMNTRHRSVDQSIPPPDPHSSVVNCANSGSKERGLGLRLGEFSHANLPAVPEQSSSRRSRSMATVLASLETLTLEMKIGQNQSSNGIVTSMPSIPDNLECNVPGDSKMHSGTNVDRLDVYKGLSSPESVGKRKEHRRYPDTMSSPSKPSRIPVPTGCVTPPHPGQATTRLVEAAFQTPPKALEHAAGLDVFELSGSTSDDAQIVDVNVQPHSVQDTSMSSEGELNVMSTESSFSTDRDGETLPHCIPHSTLSPTAIKHRGHVSGEAFSLVMCHSPGLKDIGNSDSVDQSSSNNGLEDLDDLPVVQKKKNFSADSSLLAQLKSRSSGVPNTGTGRYSNKSPDTGSAAFSAAIFKAVKRPSHLFNTSTQVEASVSSPSPCEDENDVLARTEG